MENPQLEFNNIVRKEGEEWSRGNPSLSELRDAAFEAIKLRNPPQLVLPPYQTIMQSYAGIWGAGDSYGWK